MHTAYITHPSCLLHNMGDWHPESPARLRAIDDRLHAARLFDFLAHHEAPCVHRSQLLRVPSHALYLSPCSATQSGIDVPGAGVSCSTSTFTPAALKRRSTSV